MDHHPSRPARSTLAVALGAGALVAAALAADVPGTATAAGAAPAPSPVAARSADCTQPGPYQLPQGSDPVTLDPADFTTTIDNPWWPMTPGTVWTYVERSGGEVAHVRTVVTHRTRLIQGVRARVVHDSARVHGQLVEDTRDWYAQDAGGSIWYLGERSLTYEHGHVVSTAGSWTYGRDGAFPGVIVPANPAPGCHYREEYRAGVAQDQAEVLGDDEPLRGPTGTYRDVLHTANTSPLEPQVLENKLYARGVGPVLELDLSPELGSAVLTGVTHRH